MKVAIAGSSGLIGSQLVRYLEEHDHTVLRIRRDETISPGMLEGTQVFVNLAGENIASKRWTESQKEKILASRVASTRKVIDMIHGMKAKPRLLLNASAIGIYGNGCDEVLDENSRPRDSFLSSVCRRWESEALEARSHGVNAITMRFGIVLSPDGGALAKMLPLFSAGGGGPLGSGEQYMSWIDIEDAVRAIAFFMVQPPTVAGPFNLTAPHPVRNKEFTKVLGKVLHRPAILPAPGFALKIALGEMAQELLLDSQRVSCEKLQRLGFIFKYPMLQQSLEHLLTPDGTQHSSSGNLSHV
jgi:uncharacterized protein